MSETKRKLYVDRDGFCTEASMLLMALAVVFRLIGSIGRWDDLHYLTTQLALPVFSGLLFLLCLLLFSRRAFWTTVIPVVLGVAFFVFRIMEVENEWQKVGCIVLYMVIIVLYAMCFSHKNLKWILAAVLLLAFAYHVGIEDLPVLMDLKHPVSFVDGMQEMSVLAIMLSLMFVCLAMKTTGGKAKTEPTVTAPAESEPIAAEQEPKTEPAPTEPVPVQERSIASEAAPALPEGEDAPALEPAEEGESRDN